MNLADWMLLLTTASLLGSTFLFLNIAIQEIPALTSAVLRTLIAAPICYVLMRAFGARMPTTRQGWISLFWLGLLTGAIPFGTISWGQQHIASGMAGAAMTFERHWLYQARLSLALTGPCRLLTCQYLLTH